MNDGMLHADPTIRSYRPSPIDEAFVKLSIKIIKRAALDYLVTIKSLYHEIDRRKILLLLNTKEEIERFFKGYWYLQLTEVDPTHLIKRIREMARQELLEEIRIKHGCVGEYKSNEVKKKARRKKA